MTVQQAKRAGAEALNVLASPIFHARRLDIFERTGALPLPAKSRVRGGLA